MINVLLVDDHPLLRSGAAKFIGDSGDCQVVGESDNVEDALRKAKALHPTVAVLDIMLKGTKNGVDLAKSLREELPDTKLLILTNYSQEPYIRAMAELGVNGYLLKDTPPADILNAIRMIAGGRSVFSDEVRSQVIGSYLTTSGRSEAGTGERLTLKEIEVLKLLAGGASNAEIGTALGVTVKAIQQHLSNIFGKLDARSRTEAVIQAVRRGLVVIEPEDEKG